MTAPQTEQSSVLANRGPGDSLRVVAIGGGTGLSTLLRGLKRYVASPTGSAECGEHPCLISDLAAVVTVTDDGGSSGRLRNEMNVLPPGDLRNCMVALSEDEHLLARLFQYRFDVGEGLEGHSFGNLFVAALAAVTGDFAEAIKVSSQILATRGHIFPATNSNATLAARMDDGTVVRGETKITASHKRIVELMLEPAEVAPLPQTLESIRRADVITLGPGSLYTSLVTNLLVHGIPEALAAAPAVRIFVCNLMTQANESVDLTASQHIERIYEHTQQPVFDYALINTSHVSEELKERYKLEGSEPIAADIARVEALGVKTISGDFAVEGDVLRHNYDRVAEEILGLGFAGRP